MKILARYTAKVGSGSFVVEAPWAWGDIRETILITVFDIPSRKETGAFVSFGSEVPPDDFIGVVTKVVADNPAFAKECLISLSKEFLSPYWPTHTETLSVGTTQESAIRQAIEKARRLRARVPEIVKAVLNDSVSGNQGTATVNGYNHPLFLAVGCSSDKYLSEVGRSTEVSKLIAKLNLVIDKKVTVSFEVPDTLRAWMERPAPGIYSQTISVM